jgi:hypothetical protein
MSEVGIDSGDLNTGFTVQRVGYNFRYQYARVTAATGEPDNPGFFDLFDPDNTDIVAAGVAVNDEVVRRIRQQNYDVIWPARTRTRAIAIAEAARDNNEFGAAELQRGAPGWYDVTTTRYYVDPAGWSPWIKVQDLPVWAT